MNRNSIKVALMAAITVASSMAFAAEPAPAGTGKQGMNAVPMEHPMMGTDGKKGEGKMGGDMMGMMAMMRSCHAMMGGQGTSDSAMTLKLPPGNEKLEFQMRAEMMQKMGEIGAKYADKIKEGK